MRLYDELYNKETIKDLESDLAIERISTMNENSVIVKMCSNIPFSSVRFINLDEGIEFHNNYMRALEKVSRICESEMVNARYNPKLNQVIISRK